MPSSHAELPSASCLACHPRAQGTLPGLYGGFAVGAVLCALAVLSLRLPKLPRSVKLRGLLLDGLWARRIFDRPWVGAAHLALVAGFVLLLVGSALVQLDGLVLAPRGGGFLRGTPWQAFQTVLDLAGLAVVAGAGFLLVRRLAARPRAPQHVARVVGLVALLGLAVSGFVLQGFRGNLDPGAVATPVGRIVAEALAPILPAAPTDALLYRVGWWVHGLVALSLLAWAPRSPLVHALLAPVQAASAPPHPEGALATPFDLRKLIEAGEFDIKVGVRSARDLDASTRFSLMACTACRRCDEVCPAAAAGTDLSPSALVRSLGEAAQLKEPAALVGGRVSADAVWSCLQCGACTEVCPVFVDPPRMLAELRRDIASDGRLDGRRAEVLGHLGRVGNPYGLPLAHRSAVARELGVAQASGDSCDTLYWVGCAAIYDSRVRRTAEAMLEILSRAGISVAVLGTEEKCCGDPARRLGEEGRYQELAIANIEAMTARGVRRVITQCAHCFNTLAKEYPALGGRFEVVHHATLLRELLESGALELSVPVDEVVATHDGCYVGRYDRAFAAPRDVLGSIPALLAVELPRSFERAACCGGGGASSWFDVPRLERPGVARVREARDAGVHKLAVECPFCLRMLEDAATAIEPPGSFEVRDLAEWVAAALPKGE